jgi:hypothetical protein
MRVRPRLEFAYDGIIRAKAPMFRSAKLREQLGLPTPPRRIAWQAKTSEDDAVDFLAKQQLGQRKLRLSAECRYGVVTDAQQHGSGNRFLVILDLLLHVELVFVLERSRGSVRHSPCVEMMT